MKFEKYYETSGVCTDTRSIERDCLFICLKGENFNGNTFAKEALKQGAKYVIVDEEGYADNNKVFKVNNALLYLQDLANFHRKQFDIPVIGITGSNGKTSTKELINAVLSEKYNVLATKGNLNNHIGVPLTLLKITASHEIAIIEMGANKFGDIAELAAIAVPTHGIITNIGKAHLEGFINFEGVLKTKKELYDSVASCEGLIVYNFDDPILKDALPNDIELFSYGTSKNASVQGKLIQLSPFIEMNWSIEDYTSPDLKMKMIGEYNFYNYLAAISFGILFDLTFEEINKGITSYEPTNNRSQIVKTAQNTLILDCYNANPSSMKSALESFAKINQPNKLFIIGDMLELGEESALEHDRIITLIESLNITGYTVGPLFKQTKSLNCKEQFENTAEAQQYFNTHSIENSFILFKGSRGIGLEILQNYF